MGKQWKQCQTLFFWAPKSLQMVTAAMKLKDAYSLEGKLPPRHAHGDLTSLAPHERLPEILVVPREKTPIGI